ncbi:MAG: NUDIX domain-containing protein [Hyphomonadaceae bacterium]
MLDKDWRDEGDPWTLRSVSRPFANDWFAIDTHEVIQPNGRDGTYSVIRVRRHAVGVLPIDADGRVHLVGQWRFPLGRYSWEMPEGGAERHEDAAACARRELKEETGLSADSLTVILEMDMSNSLTDERATLFLATGLTAGEASPEDVEVLQRRTAPFAEVLDRVAAGRIRDAMTVAAVLRAHHMAVSGALPPELARAMLAG